MRSGYHTRQRRAIHCRRDTKQWASRPCPSDTMLNVGWPCNAVALLNYSRHFHACTLRNTALPCLGETMRCGYLGFRRSAMPSLRVALPFMAERMQIIAEINCAMCRRRRAYRYRADHGCALAALRNSPAIHCRCKAHIRLTLLFRCRHTAAFRISAQIRAKPLRKHFTAEHCLCHTLPYNVAHRHCSSLLHNAMPLPYKSSPHSAIAQRVQDLVQWDPRKSQRQGPHALPVDVA